MAFVHVFPTVPLAVGQLGARAHGQLPLTPPAPPMLIFGRNLVLDTQSRKILAIIVSLKASRDFCREF